VNAGDARHRVKVGDLVSYRQDDAVAVGIVIGWSPRRAVANVIFNNEIWQIHARKLKVKSESR
jgi:hypothetical protein